MKPRHRSAPLFIALVLLLASLQSYAAPTFFWRAEGTTLDGTHDHTAGDSTATAESGATISATAGLVGTNGVLVSGSASQFTFVTSDAIFPPAEGSFGFLIRWTDHVITSKIFTVRGTSGDYQFSIFTGVDTDTLTAYLGDPEGAGLSVTATGLSLAENTIYGIVFRWDHAIDTFTLEVYNASTPSAPTLLDTVSDTTGWTVFPNITDSERFQIGDASGGAFTAHYDTIIAANDYSEPIEDNFGVTSYTAYGGAPASGLLLRRRRQ